MMLTTDIPEEIDDCLDQIENKEHMDLIEYIQSLIISDINRSSPNGEYDDGFRCWLSDCLDSPYDDFADSI